MADKQELPQIQKRIERCENCRFWDRREHEWPIDGQLELTVNGYYPDSEMKTEDPEGFTFAYIKAGECHAKAPSVVLNLDDDTYPDTHRGIFPLTMLNDWCGDFRPNEGATPYHVG